MQMWHVALEQTGCQSAARLCKYSLPLYQLPQARLM